MSQKFYSPLSLRRSRGYKMENIRIFAGSCIFIIVVGNLAMLQSYRAFVNKNLNQNDDEDFGNFPGIHIQRVRRDAHRDIFSEYGPQFLPYDKMIANSLGVGEGYSAQYSGTEGRMRKLMQESVRRFKISDSNSIEQRDKVSKKDFPKEEINGRNMLTCADVDRLENIRHVGSGWTKAVYKADLDGESVAVKTVDAGGRSVTDCVGQGLNMTDCYQQAAHKIVKEIVLLQALAHEHVIKVFGYCVPDRPFDGDADTTVAMVTELGEPIDQIKLLQMSWEDRLRVSYDLTKIIEFLPRTRYGSLSMNDFQRTQFVLVNGSLKLSDVDDAGFGEPACQASDQCVINIGRLNLTKKLECVEGRCKDFNEYNNIMKAGRHFTSFLLPHGAPRSLRPLLDRIVDKFDNLTASAKEILRDLDRVVGLYKSGVYLKRPKNNIKTNYKYHPQSDFPGQFDYRCRFSISGGSCTVAVFDLQEAEEVCNMDEECKGYVWSHRKTWTGRTLVHFKNDSGIPSFNKNTKLYIKPS